MSNSIQMEQAIFRDICVYTYAYLHAIAINEKKSCIWKMSRRGVWEGMDKGRGKVEMQL